MLAWPVGAWLYSLFSSQFDTVPEWRTRMQTPSLGPRVLVRQGSSVAGEGGRSVMD